MDRDFGYEEHQILGRLLETIVPETETSDAISNTRPQFISQS